MRAHEQAHIAAGRDVITSAASFTYTNGPDGKQYAVGGEVGIDTSSESKPEANISKGERIQAAALAPVDPSSQDYQVAAVGVQLVAQGEAELAKSRSNAGSTDADQRQRVLLAYSIAPPARSRFEAFA